MSKQKDNAKKVKPRANKYQKKLSINGSLDDVLKVSFKK